MQNDLNPSPGISGQNIPTPGTYNEAITSGVVAQDQLQQLRAQKMAEALRNRYAQLPEMQGRGFAAQGATPLQALSVALRRRKGSQDMRGLETQQAQYQKQIADARQAQMQQGQAERDQDYQRGLSAQNRAFKQNRMLAQEAQDARSNQVGAMQTFVGPEGQLKTVLRTGAGVVDDQGNPVNLDGYKPFSEAGGAGGSKVSPSSLRKVEDAVSMAMNVNGALSIAQEFDDKDVQSLSRPALGIAIKTFTPSKLENYVTSNQRNFSPRVLDFLQRIKGLSAKQRHTLFGAALTKLESASAEGFILGAEGLPLDLVAQRAKTLYDTNLNIVKAVDTVHGKNYQEKFPKFIELNNLNKEEDSQAETNVTVNDPDIDAFAENFKQKFGSYPDGYTPSGAPKDEAKKPYTYRPY